MKKLLILLFSLLISFNSLGEWVLSNANDGGDYYIDFDSLQIADDSLYIWTMRNLPKPNEYGTLSMVAYSQEDCKMLRSKLLKVLFYNQNMGNGEVVDSVSVDNPEWDYNPPGSIGRDATRLICHMADGLEISQAEFKNRVSSWKEFVLNN
jgi:hypothetical protein